MALEGMVSNAILDICKQAEICYVYFAEKSLDNLK